MSASKFNLARRIARAIWAALGFATPQQPIAATAAAPSFTQSLDQAVAAIDADAIRLADLTAALLTPATVDTPSEAPTFLARRRTGRPLAGQLAVTARRNVRKGRKARPVGLPAIATRPARRHASALRNKPTTKVVAKKRAPKRRHVWLSTQSRVIRPRVFASGHNVIALNRVNRGSATNHKAAPRPLRLAA
jgi:hypothetical protein